MSRDLSGITPSRLRPTADLNITPMIDVRVPLASSDLVIS
jgi:hypothetical protein